MRLDSISVINLLSHKHTFVEYKGDRINVTGENGSGKTSATVDGMIWALFGNARGATTDDLKGPWGNSMEVAIKFALNGKNYGITRKRGSSSGLVLENYTDGLDLSEKHISMTQEKIVNLLGSENSFTNTIVFKQGDALRFANMKPAERKGLIDELTGIEGMSQLEKVARQRSKAAEAERLRLQADLDRLLAAAGEVANLEIEISDCIATMAKLSQEIVEAGDKVKLADDLLATVQASHAQKTHLEGESRQADAALVRADQILSQLQNSRERTTSELDSMEDGESCPTCGSELDPTHPHVAVKIEERRDRLEELGKQIEMQELNVISKRDDKLRLDALSTKADSQITQQYEQAKRLKATGTNDLNTASSSYQGLRDRHARLVGQLEVLERDLPKIPTIEEGLAEQKKRIKGFDLIAEAFSKRGIPRELTRNFVGEIERGANALLLGLSPFSVRISLEKDGVQKAGITEGTMDVWVKDNLPERKVEMLSGGEKMRVMLAVRLATAQALAKKHERAIKTLIIDEALDGLDTSGKDAALTMISSLTSFDRMIFVTHDPSVAGYFPESIKFIKLADGSSAIV